MRLNPPIIGRNRTENPARNSGVIIAAEKVFPFFIKNRVKLIGSKNARGRVFADIPVIARHFYAIVIIGACSRTNTAGRRESDSEKAIRVIHGKTSIQF